MKYFMILNGKLMFLAVFCLLICGRVKAKASDSAKSQPAKTASAKGKEMGDIYIAGNICMIKLTDHNAIVPLEIVEKKKLIDSKGGAACAFKNMDSIRAEYSKLIDKSKEIKSCELVKERVEKGLLCITSAGGIFKRHQNKQGELGWQDLGKDGKIWYDRTEKGATPTRARLFCREKTNQLPPSITDFEVAEEHGFREIFADMNEGFFWTDWNSKPQPPNWKVYSFTNEKISVPDVKERLFVTDKNTHLIRSGKDERHSVRCIDFQGTDPLFENNPRLFQ